MNGLFYSKLTILRNPNRANDPLHSFPTLYDRSSDEEVLNFIVVGDWGMKSKIQTEIARQIIQTSKNTKSQFVISTGDNLYYYGALTSSDPSFLFTFESPFNDYDVLPSYQPPSSSSSSSQLNNTSKPPMIVNNDRNHKKGSDSDDDDDKYKGEFMKVPWFMSLGNHDNRGDPKSQVEFSDISDRWHLPNEYYYQRIPTKGRINSFNDDIHLIVIDTTPLVCPFFGDLRNNSVYASPECEVFSFSKEIRSLQSTWASLELIEELASRNDIRSLSQLLWLNETMAKIKDEKGWKIMVGHHSMESACTVHGPVLRNSIIRSFIEYGGIDVYFSGHDHTLQHIKKPSEKVHHLVTGGGGFMTGFSSFHPIDYRYPSLQFAQTNFGFISASLSSSSLDLEFLDYRGRSLYKTIIEK